MSQSETSRPGPPGESAEVLEELRSWLSANWDPDLAVGEWWERLATAGWSAPSLAKVAYGRGMTRADALEVARIIAEHGALAAPGGLGQLLAAPTIALHGTPTQVATYVRDIVTGRKGWCQLFSEPAAGSDLASLQTRAVRDGEEWVVNGQKVWTSGGHLADLGMLLARTDPHAPKHRGITFVALDMHQPGVDVRPLREMTGQALFNEVYLTDARVDAAAVIGQVNDGWAVANATLAFERSGLGAGGGGSAGAAGMATPGTVAGDLDRRAGDFVTGGRTGPSGMVQSVRDGPGSLVDLARRTGRAGDPLVRQQLAELHIWNELGRMNGLRAKAARSNGRDVPGMPNIAKLSMSHIMRLSRDLGEEILGPAGTLHGYDDEERRELAGMPVDPAVNAVTELALFAQGPSIYGGTDQIQRNIIGERVLGLPKEPGDDRARPFDELPKNL